jgi:hypothetical protein
MAEGSCVHIEAITSVRHANRRECEECVKTGSSWVHLRVCQECGGTRCCHDSPNRHATKARADEQASRDRVRGAGGTLAILLS